MRPRIRFLSSVSHSNTFYLRAAQKSREAQRANRWLRSLWYLRQISGIAIEGHRRTRKSCFFLLSLLGEDISPWGSRTRVAPLRGRIRARTYLRTQALVRSHELRAICNACIYARSRESCGLYACIYETRYIRARLPEAAGNSIVSRASHLGGEACKLNICRLVCACWP